ncbi:MAG: helix-turn-helix domain-containing protein [Candidatus Omnitrophica bacterium]|nr:helix-turn-helix domain-containing protein [Candidatus Omnitrophota bacterium]MCM8810831.1 helix-turn-helix domain-containing protein [Candidatus Omnitrophota bacterium]MCM8832386.1 helix-turn-helix domain-containing protein [Candidatus Omnitrophota bacterium]
MDLKSLSELIKKEREKKGLDYEKIYKDTMILSKFLEYIENGQWEKFPSEFHKKAVLRKYIDYLKIEGINLDDIFKKQDDFNQKDVEKGENFKKEVINKIDKKFYIIIFLSLIFFLFFIIANLILKNLSE